MHLRRRCAWRRNDRPGNRGHDHKMSHLIGEFLQRSDEVGGLASDQLLNAVHLATQLAMSGSYQPDDEWTELLRAIWHPLTTSEYE